jgi:hypothetical protein
MSKFDLLIEFFIGLICITGLVVACCLIVVAIQNTLIGVV